ncbi:MAG TPA: alpha/beta hydrolase [Spirillospora sp.]|nr:alpha/beta hydrolase [Spirillospora sp.]
MLRTLARLFGLFSLVMGWLNLIEITRKSQLALFVLKVAAGSIALVNAGLGGAAALFGLWRKDRLALLTGLIGGGLAVRHIVRVTAPHDAFEQTFGDGWRARIAPELHQRMLPRRYTLPFPEPPPVIHLRDVVIGTTPETGKALLADLWKPPAWIQPTGLAIIYLHGSGWHYADKDFGTRLFFRHLAGQGHLVLDLAYSLAPGITLPTMVGDVKRAVVWLKTHAAEHALNPERVVLVGASAGGHLALLAAYTPHQPEWTPTDLQAADTSVRGVVSYYGPADAEFYYRYTRAHFGDLWSGRSVNSRLSMKLTLYLLRAYERHLRGDGRLRLDEVGLLSPAQMLARVLGGTPDDIPDVYRQASPITHVGPHCPPTLLINGAHDIAMKPAMGRRLQQALCAAGVPAVYIELPDTDHGLDLYAQRIAPAFHAATYDLERFLALLV